MTAAIEHELIELETQTWEVLAVGGDECAAFFADLLDADPVVLLPGGYSLTDRDAIVDSMRGPPWSEYRLDAMRVTELSDDAAVVTYGAVARREGSEPYSAFMASAYARRDGRWKLAVHQQTPR